MLNKIFQDKCWKCTQRALKRVRRRRKSLNAELAIIPSTRLCNIAIDPTFCWRSGSSKTCTRSAQVLQPPSSSPLFTVA